MAMSYQKRFDLADQYVAHLDKVFDEIDDPFIESRYIGFVAVSAVTVYELAIKDIFISFSTRKHRVFGEFTSKYFERLNGRVSNRQILHEHLPRFGEKYVRRFRRKRDNKEREIFRSQRISLMSSYGNIITWRNKFAHEGILPNTPTFAEIRDSYYCGKHIIHCLAETMVR